MPRRRSRNKHGSSADLSAVAHAEAEALAKAEPNRAKRDAGPNAFGQPKAEPTKEQVQSDETLRGNGRKHNADAEHC
jgi:hypothetical protein